MYTVNHPKQHDRHEVPFALKHDKMTFIYKLFLVWEEHTVCNVTGFRSAASNTSFIYTVRSGSGMSCGRWLAESMHFVLTRRLLALVRRDLHSYRTPTGGPMVSKVIC